MRFEVVRLTGSGETGKEAVEKTVGSCYFGKEVEKHSRIAIRGAAMKRVTIMGSLTSKVFISNLSQILIIIFLVVLNGNAQTTTRSTTDKYTPSGLTPGMADVNPYNGKLSFSLPLLEIQGRGDIANPLVLPIAPYWQIRTHTIPNHSTTHYPVYSPFGPLPPVFVPNYYPDSIYSPGLIQGRKVGTPLYCGHSYSNTYTSLTVTMPGGGEIVLRDELTQGMPGNGQEVCGANPGISRGTSFVSADGSGIKFASDYEIFDAGGSTVVAENGYEEFAPSGYLIFPNGTRYRFVNGYVYWAKDRNGNTFNFEYETGNYGKRVKLIKDSLDRVVTISYLTNEDQITYDGFGGAPRTIRVLKANLSGALRSGQSLKRLGGTGGLFPEITSATNWFDPAVISSVILPNNQSYQFKYNSYGELARVELPTGAAHEYDWAAGVINGPASGSIQLYGIYRRVIESRVYSDGVKLEGKTTFSRPETLQPPYTYNNAGYTQVETFNGIDARLGASKHYYYGSPARSMFPNGFLWRGWKEGKEYQTESFATDGTTLLRRQQTEWENRPASWQWYPASDPEAPANDPRSTKQILITIENGKALGILKKTEYDNSGSSDPAYFSHLNVKKSKSYNYKVLDLDTAKTADLATIAALFSESDLVSVSETDYLYNAGYKARNILRMPSEIRLLNPSNPNDVLAKSQFSYDEQSQYYSMTDYGTTVGYEAPTGDYAHLRGNVTTKRTWVKETNTWLETHTQYDNFGNARKAWDASADATRFVETEYAAEDYYYAYPTKKIIPAPDPTGTHGTTEASSISTTYDFWTGRPLTLTDASGQVTSIDYDELLVRPKKAIPPAGGPISEKEYGDTPGDIYVKTRTQVDAENWAESTSFLDGLGRVYKTQTKDLQGDVFSEIEYDGLGRVKHVSNPYRQGEQKLWSKMRYDAAGRVVETYAPAPEEQTGTSVGKVEFGISTLPGFIGNYSEATDASGRKARSITNVFGQVVRVDEPTGNNNLGTLETPNQPSYYTYNIKGELIKIQQGQQNRYFLYDSFGRLTRVKQPEQIPNSNLATTGNPENNQWTAGFTYDIFGNVITVTDAKGTVITNDYDKAGRLKTSTYSDGTTPQVSYFYDGKGLGLTRALPYAKGNLTKVSNGISENRYTSFDNYGRVLASQQITDGQTYGMGYKYDGKGNLSEETYPNGRVVKTELDSDGAIKAISSRKTANGYFINYASNFDYDARGNIRAMRLGNGLWETAKFDSQNQVEQIGLGHSATDTSFWKTRYEYGELKETVTDTGTTTTVETAKNIGNIARQTTTVPTTSFIQTYKYDELNRLTEAKETTNGSQNWKQTFGYDRYGNRTEFSQIIGSTQLPIDNITRPNIDPEKNRFSTGQGYVYDFNGNLIQDAQNRGFTYNGDDKQTVVRDLTIPTTPENPDANVIGRYYYDGEGQRVKKVTNTETTIFVYNAAGQLIAEYSTQTNSAPTISYLTTDRLGSPRVVTDQNGNVISRRDFMPFGEELLAGAGPRSTNLKYSASGIDNVRQRFTGYEKDTETDLDFAEARMYQNQHGRFTAPDPLLESASLTNPQTFNRYIYTGNNPINYTDPSGLDWCLQTNGNLTYVPNVPCDKRGGENVNGQNIRIRRGSLDTDDKGQAGAGDVVRVNANGTATLISVSNQRAQQEGLTIQGESDPVEATTLSVSSNITSRTVGNSSLPCVPAHQCAGARNIEPLSPEAATAAADAASLILTVCGLGVDACDVGSAIVDVFNGDPLGAAASGPSAVPLLGIPVGVTKIARKLEKITEAADTASDARKASRGSNPQQNKKDGDAFRDEVADTMEKAGYEVQTEVYKPTPLGKRFIDIEVKKNGKVLGGIETKKGGSRYTSKQRAKDNYLRRHKNYIVNVVRRK